MSTIRQRARRNRNIAYVLFVLGIGNILTRVLGLVELDTSGARNMRDIYGMEWEFYVIPVILLGVACFYWYSYKELLKEAEFDDRSSARQDQSMAPPKSRPGE